jgi:hypothetical protein
VWLPHAIPRRRVQSTARSGVSDAIVGVSDEALIDALVELCSDAATRDRATETIDSWARREGSGSLAAMRSRLMRDPVIADAARAGTFLFVAGSSGWGVDLNAWLPGFVREAERLPEDKQRQEARLFLGLLRLSKETHRCMSEPPSPVSNSSRTSRLCCRSAGCVLPCPPISLPIRV